MKRLLKFRMIAFFLIITLVSGLAISWFIAGKLVEPGQSIIQKPSIGLPLKSIHIKSESGSLIAGWHIKASISKGVIVLLHGIRSTRLSMLDRAQMLYKAGYSSVLIDLQGHGESPGKKITLGHLEKYDAQAAVQFARKQHPNEKIGLIGISLGGAAATLATPLEVDALILESMYPDIHSAVHNRVRPWLGRFSNIPVELLLAQLKPRLGVSPTQLRPIDHISHVSCPVYIISGEQDYQTPPNETTSLFEAALEPKELWLVPNAGHTDLRNFAPEEYEKRILDFLKTHIE